MSQAKLNGEKIKTCVFISGRGTNLSSIIKSSRDYNFPIKISLIISDNVNAFGLWYAKKYNIPFKVFTSKNKFSFESKALLELKNKNIKLICLAGFMKILSSSFIEQFKYKILNIHPSLLPKYKGINTHKRVLKNNDKYTGCTVHLVTSKLDSGPVILKRRVLIKKNDNEETLSYKVLKQEHLAYSHAIRLICK